MTSTEDCECFFFGVFVFMERYHQPQRHNHRVMYPMRDGQARRNAFLRDTNQTSFTPKSARPGESTVFFAVVAVYGDSGRLASNVRKNRLITAFEKMNKHMYSKYGSYLMYECCMNATLPPLRSNKNERESDYFTFNVVLVL